MAGLRVLSADAGAAGPRAPQFDGYWLAPRDGVPDLIRLTDETFDLVAQHVPAYDVAAARAEFGSTVRG